MTVTLDAGHVIVFGTAIALFYWLMRAFAGWLVQNGAEPIGRALLSVYP